MQRMQSLQQLNVSSRVRLAAAARPLMKFPQRLQVPTAIAPAAEVATMLSNGASNGNGHAPEPFTIKFPEVVPGVQPPAMAYQNNVKVGAYKGSSPAFKTFILGIMAGVYTSYAGVLAVSLCAALPGLTASNPGLVKLLMGLVFPFGLLMVVVCGAELYTGNTAMMTLAIYEGKANFGDLCRNWFWSYSGNLCGSLMMVAAIAYSGILATNPLPATIALYKTTLPLHQVITRAILCNFLVCVAVWQANSCNTLPGKMMGLWTPICAFVVIGFEHSVANMFYIPMGIVLGAKVTWSQFFINNLIPVTIGNTIAGVVFMATTYSIAYGALGKKFDKPASA